MSVNKRNSEGYYDPTAYEALVKIEREARQAHAFRPMVYICSPLSGNIAANQHSARRYCRFAVDGGYIPLAPHLYFPQFMDDGSGAERDLALYMYILQLSKCSELWLFGKRISKVMIIDF